MQKFEMGYLFGPVLVILLGAWVAVVQGKSPAPLLPPPEDDPEIPAPPAPTNLPNANLTGNGTIAGAPILTPTTTTLTNLTDSGDADARVEEEGELRGLKGNANPLESLRKASAKCSVKGSYGIKGECAKYVECRRIGTIPAYKYCPSGKFFDHLRRACRNSGDAECRNVCPAEGALLPDPKDDEAYLKCERGVPMPRTCPEGHEFDPDKKKCKKSKLV